MKITFNPVKDTINRKQHGISLARAVDFEWETAVIWPDTRFDYDEERLSALGYIENRLFYLAFVEREEGIARVFSLRLATKLELKRYAET